MATIDQVSLIASPSVVESAPAAQSAAAAEMTSAAPVPTASRLIGAIAVGIALLSATATFLVLAGLTPIAPVDSVVKELLLGNVITGFLLLAIIGREVWLVVQARRRGRAGSRLHVQIVGLFAVIAAVPTVLVAVVASTTLDRGLDRFFSTRTRAMIEQSLIVADAYVSEHAASIRGEILAMAFDIGRAKPLFDTDREQFRQFLTAQAKGRGLSAAIMINPDGSTVESADVSMPKPVVLPSAELLKHITESEPQVALIPQGDHVAAAVKLHRCSIRGWLRNWRRRSRASANTLLSKRANLAFRLPSPSCLP
jgi:two-component system nitrogen regulation sensor histidine kinase NtrY